MALISKFEGETWPIRVRPKAKGSSLKDKIAKKLAGNTAKFTFEGGPDGEKTESRDLNDAGEAAIDYVLPDVPADADNYTLNASVSFKNNLIQNEKKDVGEAVRVWPKKFKLVVKDEAGAPFKGFKFRTSQGPDDLGESVTDDAGEGTVNIKKKTAEFTAAAVAPFMIKAGSLRKTSKRVYEVVGRRAFIPRFKDPVPPTDGKPLVQYVNLKKDWTDTANPIPAGRCGNEVDVVVEVYDDAGYAGGENDVVYVQVEFGRESKRNNPEPALRGADEIEKKSKNPDGTKDEDKKTNNVQTGAVKLVKNVSGGFIGTFKVDLGTAGGDTCTVKLSNTKGIFFGPKVPTLKFVNWRRLYYQLTLPQGATAPDLTRMSDALKDVFVEFKKYKDVAIATDAGPGGTALHWFDGAYMGESGKKFLNIGDYNKDHFHGKFVDDKTPVGVHVCCCHTQYDANAADCVKDFLNVEVDKTSLVTWTDGKKVVGKDQWVGKGMFPKFLKDGSDAFVSGTWQKVGEGGTTPLTAADVWINTGTNLGWFTVKLPDAARDFVNSADGKKVKLAFTVKCAKGPYLGEADGAKGWLQLIVVKQAERVTNDVMAHELGHTLQQVVKRAPAGLAENDHGRKYQANGHQGPHCADGMTKENYANGTGKSGTGYAGNFAGKAECTCIMYGENGDGSSCTGKFCDRCKPYLKAEAFTTLH
jgi:hypothetical protein